MCLGSFNEDDYRDRQLNKYLESQEEEMSNCCDAPITDEGLCSYCDEHVTTEAERQEQAMWERADAEHERRRDERED